MSFSDKEIVAGFILSLDMMAFMGVYCEFMVVKYPRRKHVYPGLRLRSLASKNGMLYIVGIGLGRTMIECDRSTIN